MSTTSDYRRGYQKGASTGKRYAERIRMEYHDRAQRAAERAERAETKQGIGHCENCAHWRKGDRPRRGWESCAWGICDVPRSAGTPWGTWANDHMSDGKIATTPRFGCVLFSSIKETAS